jgi:hypothetical protein
MAFGFAGSLTGTHPPGSPENCRDVERSGAAVAWASTSTKGFIWTIPRHGAQ